MQPSLEHETTGNLKTPEFWDISNRVDAQYFQVMTNGQHRVVNGGSVSHIGLPRKMEIRAVGGVIVRLLAVHQLTAERGLCSLESTDQVCWSLMITG